MCLRQSCWSSVGGPGALGKDFAMPAQSQRSRANQNELAAILAKVVVSDSARRRRQSREASLTSPVRSRDLCRVDELVTKTLRLSSEPMARRKRQPPTHDRSALSDCGGVARREGSAIGTNRRSIGGDGGFGRKCFRGVVCNERFCTFPFFCSSREFAWIFTSSGAKFFRKKNSQTTHFSHHNTTLG